MVKSVTGIALDILSTVFIEPMDEDAIDAIDEMTEQAFDDQCTGANPRYPMMKEIKQMYLNAYYGKHFVEQPMPATDLTVTAPDAIKAVYTKSKKA